MGVGILTFIGAIYGTRKTSKDNKDAVNQQLTGARSERVRACLRTGLRAGDVSGCSGAERGVSLT